MISAHYKRIGLALLVLLMLLGWGIQVAAAAETYQFVAKWGGTASGTADGMFYNPCGVAVDGAGNVLVADTNNNRIQKFTPTGTFLSKWGGYGTANGKFYSPWDLAVDGAGNVYIVDSSNNRVQKFTSAGTFVTAWGTSGTGNSQFDAPRGIAVDTQGNVYVTDRNNHRVQKFNSAGTFVTKWGTLGDGNGQLERPGECAVDGAGNVYVADQYNHRIQKFTSTGAFVTAWGSYGSGDGQFDNPIGIAVDTQGNVYVADWINHRVQKFTSTGAFVAKWGTQGTGNGQFNAPMGIAVDGAGNVYVTEWENNRVQKFAIPGATPSPTASSVKLVPGASAVPRDLNGDGKYEDVNGNGRTDFADIVLYFNQMAWIAANEPVSAFDYNGNSRIDFADVVQLFNSLGGSTPTPTPTPTLTVTAIAPNTGTRGSTVAVSNLAGTRFVSGATVKLVHSGSSDIQATNVVVVSPTRITCQFSLPPTAALGAWDVVVTSGSSSATLPGGFTVMSPTPTPTPTATPSEVTLTSTPPEAVIDLPGELVGWDPYYTPVQLVASGIPTGVTSVTFVAKDASSDFDEKGTRQKTVAVSGGRATTTFYASWWILAPSDYAVVAVYSNYGTGSEQELARLQIPVRTRYPS